MALEALIVETPKNRGGSLFVSTSLGSFYVDGYKHSFPSKIDNKKKNQGLSQLWYKLNHEEFNEVISASVKKNMPGTFPVIQIHAPLSVAEARHMTLEEIKRSLVRHPDVKDKRLGPWVTRMFDYFIREPIDARKPYKIKDLEDHALTGKSEKHQYWIKKVFEILNKAYPLNGHSLVQNDDTPKVRIPGCLPEEFFHRGHYTALARWKIGPVGSYVSLDDILVDVLKRKKEIEERLVKYKSSLTTRRRNILEEAFKNYNGNNFEEIKEILTKGMRISIGEEVLEERKELENKIRSLGVTLAKNDASARINYKENSLDVHFNEDIVELGWLNYLRMRTKDEILGRNLAVCDTEQPLFAHEDWTTSWLAILGYQHGKINDKVIYTLWPTTKEEISGYKIVVCDSEDDLVNRTTCYINDGGFDGFVAYNAKHDTMQLRDGGDFFIGLRDTKPMKEVTLKFFERIRIAGMEVVDPLQWAKVQLKFLHNQKLEMVAKHLLGDDIFSKSINYAQQEELELVCKTGDYKYLSDGSVEIVREHLGVNVFDVSKIQDLNKVCADIIAGYVGGDVDVLPNLLDNEMFRHGLEDLSVISEIFLVDIPRLMHSPSSINDYQARMFFENTGTFLDAIFPMTQNFMKYVKKAKNKFKQINGKQLKASGRHGVVETVYRVHVSKGRMFRDAVSSSFGDKSELLDKFYGHVDSVDNPDRSFFLAQYEDALFDWIVKDYGAYLMEREKLERMLSHDERWDNGRYRSYERGDSIDQYEFAAFCLKIKNELKEMDENLGTDYFQRFKHKNVTLDILAEALYERKPFRRNRVGIVADKDNREFIEKYKLFDEGSPLKQIRDLWNQWAKVEARRRVIAGKTIRDADWFEVKFEIEYDRIKKYLSDNGLEIVNVQGDYLYLVGDRNKILNGPRELTLVEEIPKAYIAPSDNGVKSFYNQHGWLHGLRNNNYVLNKFEQEVYSPLIELLLDEEYEKAAELIRSKADEFDRMEDQRTGKEDLLYHSRSTDIYHGYRHGKTFNFVDLDVIEEEVPKNQGERWFVETKRDDTKVKRYVKFDEGENKWYFLRMASKDKERDDVKKNRVYVMPVELFSPDFDLYRERIMRRVGKILAPSCISDCVKMFEHKEDVKMMVRKKNAAYYARAA